MREAEKDEVPVSFEYVASYRVTLVIE